MTTIVVAQVSKKDRKGGATAVGLKDEDNTWYNLFYPKGSKVPDIEDGDTVSFDFEENDFGNQADRKTLKVKSKSANHSEDKPAKVATNTSGKSSYDSDGARRGNALSNAATLLAAGIKPTEIYQVLLKAAREVIRAGDDLLKPIEAEPAKAVGAKKTTKAKVTKAEEEIDPEMDDFDKLQSMHLTDEDSDEA